MSAPSRTHMYVTTAAVAGLAAQLSSRDEEILRELARVRVLSGQQIERLLFHDLAVPTRARSRVLARLVRDRLVATLARRIGGVRAGSGGLVYSLDSAGRRVLRLLDHGADDAPVRRPWTPGLPFLRHTLDTSELYVRLREATRRGELELTDFRAEPAAWQRTATLGTLKPDAYALVAYGDIEDAWWIEVDEGTESRATVRRKLDLYLLVAQSGQIGPHGVLPRVLVTVPDERRQDILRDLIRSLSPPAEGLVYVVRHAEAVPYITQVLRQ